MTAKTRRRVFLSVVALALTLPAELIMLEALQRPDEKLAVEQWVRRLDRANLTAAADAIQSYSLSYRREIMRAVSPQKRAAVWQNHIERYIRMHPELDKGAVDVLQTAKSAVTARALSKPSAADRAAMRAVAEQVEALLGRDEALYLFHDLGPRGSRLAGAEPLVMKIATMVRSQFVVAARNWDCECAMGFGCGGYSDICSTQEYCQWDVDWPMCGWWWNEICDGMCVMW